MKQLLNFIPLICFFVFLMFYDIFVAVKALVISSTLAFALSWLLFKKIEKVELFSFLMVIVFGGLTLYFQNPDFIKWKVTIINFLFAAVLLISQIMFKKNLLQKLLGKELILAEQAWNKLNIIWALFFMTCGMASLYVTYYMSIEFFGVFKAFILPGASLVLTVISGVYIYKRAEMNKKENES